MEPVKRFVNCDKCGSTLVEGGVFPCRDLYTTPEDIIENCGTIMKQWQTAPEHPAEDTFETAQWPMADVPPPALKAQVGGDHYLTLAIQPMEYSMANKLDPAQHTIIKYVTRFRDKNGIEDLEKAKHCIDLLIEFERAAGRS